MNRSAANFSVPRTIGWTALAAMMMGFCLTNASNAFEAWSPQDASAPTIGQSAPDDAADAETSPEVETEEENGQAPSLEEAAADPSTPEAEAATEPPTISPPSNEEASNGSDAAETPDTTTLPPLEVEEAETPVPPKPVQEGEVAEVGDVDVAVEKETAPSDWRDWGWLKIVVFLVILFGTYAVGILLGQMWRMPEHSFRIFVILLCLFGSAAANVFGLHRLNLGIDLRGGVILVYNVFPSKTQDTPQEEDGEEEVREEREAGSQGIQWDELKKAIGMRVNPAGVREISIQRLGNHQVRIIIPEVDDAEVSRLEGVISEAGTLEFRVLARENLDESLVKRAMSEPTDRLRDAEGNLLAWWVPVAEKEVENLIGGTSVQREQDGGYEILVLNDPFNVTGEDIGRKREGMNQETGQPNVQFNLYARGAKDFSNLTSFYKPKQGQENSTTRRLGIILNGELYSAPNIKEAITGGQVSIDFGRRDTPAEREALRQEIEDLIQVLNAGSLPAELSEEPVSRMLTGPTLGAETIRKGKTAIFWSMILVLAFMIVYYRFSGLIACFAVLLNLSLIFAVMMAVHAAFTLPGLAGLVLTVGIAVDANVLIFERIREELKQGSTLRMAIRNGFQRASTAIYDANITTLITAVILYIVGSEQVKGFAVTLFLGVTFSMFTAIYCGRTIFEIAERRRWIRKLKMMQIVSQPNLKFMDKRKPAGIISVVLILLGLVAVVMRGKGLLDIDFVGGVSVEAVFHEPQDQGEIYNQLEDRLPDLSVQNLHMSSSGEENGDGEVDLTKLENTHFLINTSSPPEIEAEEYLETVTTTLEEQFGKTLVHYDMNYDILSATEPAQGEGLPEVVAEVTMEPKINSKGLAADLDREMENALDAGEIARDFDIDLTNEKMEGRDDSTAFGEWTLTMNTTEKDAQIVLDRVRQQINKQPYFPSSNKIGGAVAQQTRNSAISALLGSLICIVLYIWLRFQKISYGLAAVVALVHDVLITLGLLAASAWLVPFLGFAGIETFKIGLPVVAAFLTIIGYSLNDTIVLFDRVREIRGKMPNLTIPLIDKSINQTLSRTLLTSLTTLIVVLILYFFGGEGIHTFAFALVAGVLVGTYSSIFIASPALYWMIGTPEDKKDSETKAV